MRAVLAALLAAFLLVGGLVLLWPDEEVRFQPASNATNADLAEKPAGCENRTAQAHGPAAASEASAWTICSTHTGYASLEPTLGIRADGTIRFAPAQEDAWSSLDPDGLAVSEDGGRSWELRQPSLADQPAHPVSPDPFLHHDPTTGRTFLDSLTTVNCSSLSTTEDAGRSWNHTLAGCTETDHQSIFTGPPLVADTVGYPNVVYRCAANLVGVGPELGHATTCQRSLDGGHTWQPWGEPAFVSDPAREGHGNLPGSCGPLAGPLEAGRDATVEAREDVRLDAGADAYLNRATLETDAALAVHAGSASDAVLVQYARLLDEDETATVGPEDVEVVGEPAEASVERA
jgi:hypothetical protein